MSSEDSADALYRNLQAFLKYPAETLDREIKDWLDLTDLKRGLECANLAKACIALENYGGGSVLIGFAQTRNLWEPNNSGRPSQEDYGAWYSVDHVNSVVARYAEPPFHCEVHNVRHPHSDHEFPIVLVPGTEKVPIQCKRDDPEREHCRHHAHFTRLAGPPRSEEPRTAKDWNDIHEKCFSNRLAQWLRPLGGSIPGLDTGPFAPTGGDAMRRVLNRWFGECEARLAGELERQREQGGADPYSHGRWTAAYVLEGDISPPSLGKLLEVMRRAQHRRVGWPAWLIIETPEAKPASVDDDRLELSLIGMEAGSPSHADFWRAAPDGKMYMTRGYPEDDPGRSGFEAGTQFDLVLPIWRIGECVLHAKRLAEALGDASATVHFRASWQGLRERELVSWANDRRQVYPGRISRDDSLQADITFKADTAEADLPRIVHGLTEGLYLRFDLLETQAKEPMFREELERMVRGM